ncbi:imidazole glycerol phosphate synthase subunit HisH [Vibrio brasiliensis]|uniref:Imidazole glycerol phosphate synthase subunit HisH n=1 Tax=Vibrio brasiliensis LMG 20546 TaxID=945543 RepID=E8M045_9VIBR|nr:imidazole glycerol phosphate synthase subunit HisH [Vibrio brasiliensis]EGA63697.1 imidazole glycerol phosphate synthase subunit HisH [Vibrio brasiliensis LMG 20546]
MKIAIIDYKIGNVKSIINVLRNLHVEPILTSERDVILNCDGAILPGVGAFSHGMKGLVDYGLVEVIKEFTTIGKPLMGICLGMQMLMDSSDEFGYSEGLGLISGRVSKLVPNDGSKIPHVGWKPIKKSSIDGGQKLLRKVEEHDRLYFVHSYVVRPEEPENILSTSQYGGIEFCSSVNKGNIYGFQFHPEKSAIAGISIMKEFINLCEKVK